MKFGEKNVGMIDRVTRIIVGFLIIGAGAKFIDFPLNLIVALIGFIIVATGALGTCAIYSMLGMNTLGEEETKQAKAAPASTAKKTRRKIKTQ